MSDQRRGGAEIVRVIETGSDPTAQPSRALIYAKNVLGVTQLFSRASDGSIMQIGTGGGGGSSIGGSIGGGPVTGSILFVGSGGVLAQDNGNLFWDATNQFVGLGTSSPGYQFDLRKTLGPTSIHIRAGAVTDTGGYISSNQDNQIQISGGMAFDGTNWKAKATTASYVGAQNGGVEFGADSGLTPGNSFTPTPRMIMYPAGGLEFVNSSSATASLANAGKITYTTTGQKFQASANTGSYLDIGLLAAALTTGSIAFADSSGHIAQDNTNLAWDATGKILSLKTNTSGQAPLSLTGTATNTYSGISLFDSSSVAAVNIGYGNSAVAITYLQGKGYWYAAASADFVLANPTKNEFIFGMTDGSTSLQMENGGSATVSAANTGKIIYNTTGQKFQYSANGAAFADFGAGGSGMAIGSAVTSGTAGSVLFVGTGPVLAQDNTNFFWDTTNQQLNLKTGITSLHPLKITGTSTDSYSAISFYDSSASAKGLIGYGNSATASTWLRGLNFIYTNGPSWIVSSTTAEVMRFDVTNARFGIGCAPAVAIEIQQSAAAAALVRLTNTSTTGYSAFELFKSDATSQISFGWGNASVAVTYLQGRGYWYSVQSTDFVFANPTQAEFQLGMTHGSTFLQFGDGASAAASATSTGRIRYNNTGTKFQASVSTGSYFDISLLAAALTTNSVPFADSSGHLAQDNTNFWWDNTNKVLNLKTATSNVSPLNLVGTATNSYSAFTTFDSSATFQGQIGYGNSAVPATWLRSLNHLYSQGADWIIANSSAELFRFGCTSNQSALTMTNGGSSAVSAASTGKIIYNTTGQKFQASLNGLSYADLTLWSVVLNSTLLSGSLTGWNQRTGSWTADGSGFHINSATSECYLSYESGGAESAPFAMNNYAMQVDLAWNASAATTTDIGLVLSAGSAALANGCIRAFVRRDGTSIGVDLFGGAMGITVNPGLGTMTTGVFHTFKVEVSGTAYSVYFDGVCYLTARLEGSTGAGVTTSFAATRVGLWANQGFADFKNVKIWRSASPS